MARSARGDRGIRRTARRRLTERIGAIRRSRPRSRIAASSTVPWRALEPEFDAEHGGWGGAPEVPAADDDRVPAAAARRGGRRAGARDGAPHARPDGRRRHPRPAGRRLSPLRDRRDLARAALREDALRQRASSPASTLHAWQATGDPRYADVARDTLEYLLRDLRRPDGTFAASQDADTNGEEGLTFVWSADEIRSLLGTDAPAFLEAYGVTDAGNWEGATILSRIGPRGDEAAEQALAAGRERLLRRAVQAAATGARRQGAGRLERTRDRGARRCLAGVRRTRCRPVPRGRRGDGVGPARWTARRGWTAPTLVEGRTSIPRRRCSRTTRISRTACWRSTRPRSRSGGSPRPVT